MKIDNMLCVSITQIDEETRIYLEKHWLSNGTNLGLFMLTPEEIYDSELPNKLQELVATARVNSAVGIHISDIYNRGAVSAREPFDVMWDFVESHLPEYHSRDDVTYVQYLLKDLHVGYVPPELIPRLVALHGEALTTYMDDHYGNI